MANVLTTGVSALLAFQRALDTVSHNVANANTPGYSRQITDLAAQPADRLGSSFIGNGVKVTAIRRLYEGAIASQLHGSTSSFHQLQVYAGYAERIDKLFNDSGTGLAASMQQFTNALETLSTSPTSATARQVVLSQAQSLVNRMRSYQGSIETIGAQLNAQITSEANTVSELAASVAALNLQIITAQGSGLASPNDLQDRRDQIISQLSEHVAVSTVVEDSGNMNVYIGSGQALVSAGSAARLVVAPGEFDRNELRLTLSGYATPADVTQVVNGGALGGLMQLRGDLLQPTSNALGQIALSVGELANQQQAAGLDLNGNRGTDLFALGGALGLGSTFNTGSATLAVTRSDLAALTTADYQLRFVGGSWSATRADTGAAVALSGTGTVASPLRFDGVDVVVTGAAQSGDAFLVRPTAGVVAGLRTLLNSTEKLAAAGPLVTAASEANTGGGVINAGSLIPGGSWVRGDYTLRFTAPNAWQAINASNVVVASGAYTGGAAINFNGMSVAVSGTPAANDSFSIKDNINGKGDGRNARALIDRLNGPVLNGGTLSSNDAVGHMVGKIGVQVSQALIGRDAQSVVLEDSKNAMLGISGVNLDEEAADLVRFQQAYQAAARVIAVAKDVFDTLIAATGR